MVESLKASRPGCRRVENSCEPILVAFDLAPDQACVHFKLGFTNLLIDRFDNFLIGRSIRIILFLLVNMYFDQDFILFFPLLPEPELGDHPGRFNNLFVRLFHLIYGGVR
jgi:hypothetical protein